MTTPSIIVHVGPSAHRPDQPCGICRHVAEARAAALDTVEREVLVERERQARRGKPQRPEWAVNVLAAIDALRERSGE